tara:strand:- start:28368 stop:28772 length:405 start_codon:yes stop_codon:yes gene_type:complete
MTNYLNNIIILYGLFFLSSCGSEIKIDVEKNIAHSTNEVKIIIKNTAEKELTGWWVYGEGQHIFKDEESLEEFDIEFKDEDPKEIVELYLAICEMEYFPLESKIIAHKRKDVLRNQITLIVSKINILHVEGCGE